MNTSTMTGQTTLAAFVAATGVHAEAADDAGGVRLFHEFDGETQREAFNLADYAVDAVCGPFLHMRPKDPKASAGGCRLYQRAADGFPVGADQVMKEAYRQIPVAVGGRFQAGRAYGYERPLAVHGWAWSDTFNRWSALVTFRDGWHGFTYPATW